MFAANDQRYMRPLPMHKPQAATRPAPLTPRERQVLEQVASGLSNKAIAISLGLSPHTVKRHVAHLFDKLDLIKRGQATAWYYLNPASSGCCDSGR